jgi:SpoVK/Ycf46/Vps4 family AAA+-type ATPase
LKKSTPGRLQKILHVDLPSADDRVSILKAITKRRPLLSPDVDFAKLANDQVGYY